MRVTVGGVVSSKAKWSAVAGRIAGTLGRLAGGRQPQFGGLAESVAKVGYAMDTVDETGARGIASLPAMREMLAEPQERALQALRVGLNGHYGRPGKDGTRLYLKIGGAEMYRHDEWHMFGISSEIAHIDRSLQVSGDIYLDGQLQPRAVGKLLALEFIETKQGRLVVNGGVVKLDEHVRGRGFTDHLIFGLRDYFKRSGVDHVKIKAGLTHGGRGWAGLCDWDPDDVVGNRQSMISRIDKVMTEVHHPADRTLLHNWWTAFNGPPESWPSPRDLRRLALGEQILQGSEWSGMYKL